MRTETAPHPQPPSLAPSQVRLAGGDPVSGIPTPNQFRAARAWLGWSRGRAGHSAGICQQTVGGIERGEARTSDQMRAALRAAYEAHGADFGDGRGIRFGG